MPVCKECSTEESHGWQKLSSGDIVCIDCYCDIQMREIERKERISKNLLKKEMAPKHATRRSARINRSAKLNVVVTRSHKEKFVLKKIPWKAKKPVLTPIRSERVLHKDQMFSRGDIVSRVEDGRIHYAQVKGFLTDQYCNKFTVITWLIPGKDDSKLPNPMREFDPSNYFIGPEEDRHHPLDLFSYVMHAPSEYFMSKQPYHALQDYTFTCDYYSNEKL